MGLCFDSDKKQAEKDFVQSLIVVQVVPVMQIMQVKFLKTA
jgi:hypothetical protein